MLKAITYLIYSSSGLIALVVVGKSLKGWLFNFMYNNYTRLGEKGIAEDSRVCLHRIQRE